MFYDQFDMEKGTCRRRRHKSEEGWRAPTPPDIQKYIGLHKTLPFDLVLEAWPGISFVLSDTTLEDAFQEPPSMLGPAMCRHCGIALADCEYHR
jgi:hypothetical protein